jgi:hypothetical protein
MVYISNYACKCIGNGVDFIMYRVCGVRGDIGLWYNMIAFLCICVYVGTGRH